MTFLSIFVPDFPVEAVLRVEFELRSRMVAVIEGKPPLQKVFAVNENARHAGLDAGMTRLQAEAWPGLALRCRSAMQEATAHAALLDCAQSFSPRVEDTAPDTLVLDICGSEALFGPPPKLARDLAQRASHLGFETNVAVASNPDAAIIAARGYSGVTVLSPVNQEERLGHLPLDVLFARHSEEKGEEAIPLLDTLERWGIRTLRAFTALPEIAISERLGQKGVHLQKLARGTIARTLVPVDPPLVFEEAVELEHPLVLLEPLAFLLNRLLEHVCARLAARALATQELRLRLELDPSCHSDNESSSQNAGALIPSPVRHSTLFTRTLNLPVPMLDAKIFLKLLQLDLQAHPPGAPITKIWLSAEPARLRAGQAGLFVPPSPEPQKLELTMARISSIVGEGNVGSVELLDTHHPEGFRMRHFTPRDLTVKRKRKHSAENLEPVKDSQASTAPEAPERQSQADVVTALRLFRPPQLVTVSMRDGGPARIACASDKIFDGEILWQAGPWRSSGDWWEQEPWARDEWDIAVQGHDGLVLYRLVHDLLSGKWFVEGTYD
jgi:protein ImuB